MSVLLQFYHSFLLFRYLNWLLTNVFLGTFRCRNISALQECLSKIMLVREKELDTARQYFELLLLNDEVCSVARTPFPTAPMTASPSLGGV